MPANESPWSRHQRGGGRQLRPAIQGNEMIRAEPKRTTVLMEYINGPAAENFPHQQAHADVRRSSH